MDKVVRYFEFSFANQDKTKLHGKGLAVFSLIKILVLVI